MAVTLEQMSALSMLMESERRIGDLYTIFAGQFPEQMVFWQKLASEEEAHATWVRTILMQMRDGHIEFDAVHYAPESYQLFLDYMGRIITQATTYQASLFQALTVAKDIEEALLEKNFTAVFVPKTPETTRMLRRMHASTEEHLRRVTEMALKYKPKAR
jgi:hypothetical protein